MSPLPVVAFVSLSRVLVPLVVGCIALSSGGLLWYADSRSRQTAASHLSDAASSSSVLMAVTSRIYRYWPVGAKLWILPLRSITRVDGNTLVIGQGARVLSAALTRGTAAPAARELVSEYLRGGSIMPVVTGLDFQVVDKEYQVVFSTLSLDVTEVIGAYDLRGEIDPLYPRR